MAKKTSNKRSNTQAVAPKAAASTTPVLVQFPSISTKEYLDCRVLLEDQILLIDVSNGYANMQL